MTTIGSIAAKPTALRFAEKTHPKRTMTLWRTMATVGTAVAIKGGAGARHYEPIVRSPAHGLSRSQQETGNRSGTRWQVTVAALTVTEFTVVREPARRAAWTPKVSMLSRTQLQS